jgi:hypothetical protein
LRGFVVPLREKRTAVFLFDDPAAQAFLGFGFRIALILILRALAKATGFREPGNPFFLETFTRISFVLPSQLLGTSYIDPVFILSRS